MGETVTPAETEIPDHVNAAGPAGLVRGQSVTDACMGWAATEAALTQLAEGVRRRR